MKKILLLIAIISCFNIANGASTQHQSYDEDTSTINNSPSNSEEDQASEGSSNEALNFPPPQSIKVSRKPYPTGIIIHLRKLLHEKKFNQLNDILETFQSDTLNDIANEDRLIDAYQAFATEDERWELLLNEWVTKSPDNYQPYIARAKYYYTKGWKFRGSEWASETDPKQFDLMNEQFDLAIKDIETSQKLEPQSMIGYSIAINIAKTRGDRSQAKQTLEKALQINPLTYWVRVAYMESLLPQWGGSFDDMQLFAASSYTQVSRNPLLHLLFGKIYMDVGAMYERRKMYKYADELYSKALEYGDLYGAFSKRGRVRIRQERFAEAYDDLTNAIRLFPESSYSLSLRAIALSKLADYENATTDMEKALILDPTDEIVLNRNDRLVSEMERTGYEMDKGRKYDEAIDIFSLAIKLHPNDASLYDRRARAFIATNKNSKALVDERKAIELEPDNFRYVRMIDWLLAKQKKWDDIITHWNNYIELQPEDGRAYVERGGAYYRKGDIRSAVADAKTAADLGNAEGKEAYEKFRHLLN